ncbi:MAG: hypothetical protein Q8R35_01055 [bacterium]|nr:hypothetical protein [bacterium]
MRRLLVAVLVILMAAVSAEARRHLPMEIRFIEALEILRVDKACHDPFTQEPAVCEFYIDRSSNAHYRIIYRSLNFSTAWRLEGGLWRIIWPRGPDCSQELCA